MKKLFIVIVGILSIFPVVAQNKVKWGIEVGAGMSAWMGKSADGSKPLFNHKVGVTLDIPLNWLVSFQTGLNWTSKGANYKMFNDFITDSETFSKVNVNQNYFQMPLLAAFHVGATSNFDMVFTVGPYLAYGVSGRSETQVDAMTMSWPTFDDLYLKDRYISSGYNRFDAGVQTGVGLDFKDWTVGLDADFGFCKIVSGNSPYNFAIYFTLGYKF
ncbi:porin family protein [uncultured Bacteroides sp.]|uniref:porin family protein n=1 Tax=uncultured Bacteroides sp. TaxID=162156 RepID=UPI00260D5D8B|nr:porin family protein [uncultured Bacteroides sp.]